MSQAHGKGVGSRGARVHLQTLEHCLDKGDLMDTVKVAAALIWRDDTVLACQVASGPFAGLYELPGGKIESGESAEKACRREVEEELRCELSTLWPLDHVSYDYPDFHLSMEVFACELASGSEPQATEHSELRWLSRQELVEVQRLPADAQLMSLVATYWRDLRGDH